MAEERRARRGASGSRDGIPDAPTHAGRPRVLVICDVRLYRDGLVQSLARHIGGATLDGTDASPASLAKAVALAPDAIIFDIANSGGLRTAKALAAHPP